jgi:signal peptidase I
MRQTLQDGDRLLVVNSGLVREYRQGDIVIARKQSFSDDPIVKRVIAVGGQTIDIDFNAGIVYVDGVALEEDYINDLTYTYEGTDFPLTVPEGSVFLMGDNRNMSTDSREPRIGPVDLRNLIGKAVFLVFPGPDTVTEKRDFGRIGLLRKG